MNLKAFVASVDSSVTRVPGTAVFLAQNLETVPGAMLHSIKHYKALHVRNILVSVVVLDIPRFADSNRVAVQRMDKNFWQVKMFYGFMEQPNIPAGLEWCAEDGIDLDWMDTSYFLGRETLIPRMGSEMPLWREKIFVAMFQNAGSATAFFGLPPNRVVELGTHVEM